MAIALRAMAARPGAGAAVPGAPLFDLRPVHGRDSLWHDVEAAVAGAVDRDLLRVAGQRLPGEYAAADLLPGCRRRRIGRSHGHFSSGA